jgi:hypothetical protein
MAKHFYQKNMETYDSVFEIFKAFLKASFTVTQFKKTKGVSVYHAQRSVCHAGVNFTNVLRAAFTHTDPRNPKRQSSHQCLFVL